MWNPFKRLTESDGKRLRRIEQEVADLADNLTLVMERSARIDARLRQRASRDARQRFTGDTDRDNGDGAGGVGEAVEAGGEPLAASTLPMGTQPTFTKDQLRAFARARGLVR